MADPEISKMGGGGDSKKFTLLRTYTCDVTYQLFTVFIKSQFETLLIGDSIVCCKAMKCDILCPTKVGSIQQKYANSSIERHGPPSKAKLVSGATEE